MHLCAEVLRLLVQLLLVGCGPISLRKVLMRIHLLTISLVASWNDEGFLSTRVIILHMSWIGNAHDRLKLVLFTSCCCLLIVTLGTLSSLLHLLSATVCILLFAQRH